LNINYQVLY